MKKDDGKREDKDDEEVKAPSEETLEEVLDEDKDEDEDLPDPLLLDDEKAWE